MWSTPGTWTVGPHDPFHVRNDGSAPMNATPARPDRAAADG